MVAISVAERLEIGVDDGSRVLLGVLTGSSVFPASGFAVGIGVEVGVCVLVGFGVTVGVQVEVGVGLAVGVGPCPKGHTM